MSPTHWRPLRGPGSADARRREPAALRKRLLEPFDEACRNVLIEPPPRDGGVESWSTLLAAMRLPGVRARPVLHRFRRAAPGATRRCQPPARPGWMRRCGPDRGPGRTPCTRMSVLRGRAWFSPRHIRNRSCSTVSTGRPPRGGHRRVLTCTPTGGAAPPRTLRRCAGRDDGCAACSPRPGPRCR